MATINRFLITCLLRADGDRETVDEKRHNEKTIGVASYAAVPGDWNLQDWKMTE